MSNITDEVGKEVFTKLENLLKFFVKDISKILQEMQKQQHDRNKQNELLQELKNKIEEYEKQLSQMEIKETTQNTNIEKRQNFKELCPSSFKKTQDFIIKEFLSDLNKNDILYDKDKLEKLILEKCDLSKIFSSFSQDDDFKDIIKNYCDEYEDCHLKQYEYRDRILYGLLEKDTDIKEDILTPFMHEVIDSQEIEKALETQKHKKDIQNFIDSFEEKKGIENITSKITKSTDDFER